MLGGMMKWMRLSAALLAVLLLSACGATRRAVIVQPSDGAVPSRTSATAPAHASGSYHVARGDTLYSIAFRHGVDFRDLAAWNHIAAPYRIWPGQTLRLSAAGGRTSAVARSNTPVAAAGRHPAAAPVFEQVTPQAPPRAPAPVAETAKSSSATSPAATAAAPVPPRPAVAAEPSPKGATRNSGGVDWRWPADGPLIKRFQAGDAIPGIELGGKAGDPVRAAADGVVVYSGNGLVGYGELIIIKHNDSFLSAYGHNRKRLVKEGQRVTAGQLIAEMGATGASRDELQFQIRRDGNPVDPLEYLPAR
ncbi:MAG TPA: peptidoglycan DD-metalloendopeptidase family protein [Frateuria sp.]|uniref:peptidoglycan DD-metalloendopeptidase family protein n=1 Tax=Frateuria sp. TaxID=2211372 RepID=UPI002DEB276A|nr:peptidoglycan DD-metalloendopeptidase family protein [Frateuria sp.]